MHFDPYEKPEARHRRRVSNICICVLALMLVAGIVALCFRKTTVKPYYFDQFKLSEQQMNTEGVSQFTSLSAVLTNKQNPSHSIRRDQKFAQSYPTVNALLLMQSEVYREQIPYAELCNGALSIAQIYPSAVTGVRNMDVAVFSLRTDWADGGLFECHLLDMTRFTLTYDVSSGTVTYLPYQESTYRLQIPSLTFCVSGDAVTSNLTYSLSFNSVYTQSQLSKQMLDRAIMDDVNHSYHSPVYSATEYRSTITTEVPKSRLAGGEARVKYSLDNLYGSFAYSSFSVSVSGTPNFSITVG